MRKRNTAGALCIALVAAGASGLIASSSGCGSSNDKETVTGTSSTSAQPARRPVPRSLGTLESSAEDIIDFARQRDRARVVATARKLRRTAYGSAGADLRSAGVPEAVTTSLRDRAQLVESVARRAELLRVSLAANQVSALMPALYARFDDPIPPGVLKLDYLDREAELRSRAGDRTSVPAVVNELSSTWESLRPRVVKAGGRGAAGRYTRHVAAMRRLVRGSSGAALQRQAAIGLGLVDKLEGVFRRR